MSAYETFSFLPRLTATQIKAQVGHLLDKGYVPFIEYAEGNASREMYWKLWNLPTDKGVTVPGLISQLESCARTNPYSFVRISGYCRKSGVNAISFTVHSPPDVA